MIHACQKTGKCASPKIKKIADSIKEKAAEDFAKTKHKGLPETKNKKKKKKFKEWIKNNHPEFEIKENILGTLGNIGLGLTAMANTAIKRSKSYHGYDYDNNTHNVADNTTVTKNYVDDFLNQKWNWHKVLNPIKPIIKFVYWYKTEEEKLSDDDFIPINILDIHKINNQISKNATGVSVNKATGNAVPIEKGINYLKNSKNYWNDNEINKFYDVIKKMGEKPEDFGGTDIRTNK